MATDMTPPPSAVRVQVLDQHRELRRLITRIVDATAPGRPREPLMGLLRDLRARLFQHLAFEEQTLTSALAEADAWGPQRVRDMLDEHARQRAEVEVIVQGIETWDAEGLNLAARTLAADLIHDMDAEERGPLSPDLLRDDVVNVDQATD
jgi:hypothetical protein